MKIVFIAQGCIPFDGRTLDERPLGGIETAVIRLAEALERRGVRCYVLTGMAAPRLSAPLFLPMTAYSDLGAVDLTVVVRDWQGCHLPIQTKRKLLWTGDSHDQPMTFGLSDLRVLESLSGVLAVSQWHAKTLAHFAQIPAEKLFVLRNGIHLPFFEGPFFDGVEARHPKRLIYSSTPFRGLRFLPELFTSIRALHPDAELHVFSSYEVYAPVAGQGTSAHVPHTAEQEFQEITAALATLPGAFMHGSVPQQILAREFMKSAVLAYPNTFEETSCITVMEAAAAGCPTVTSHRAALPESVGDSGILIPGEPGTAEYHKQFVSAVDSLLSDPALWARYSTAGLASRTRLSWDTRADELLTLYQQL